MSRKLEDEQRLSGFTGDTISVILIKDRTGTFLLVQLLRLHAPKVQGLGFDPWSGN